MLPRQRLLISLWAHVRQECSARSGGAWTPLVQLRNIGTPSDPSHASSPIPSSSSSTTFSCFSSSAHEQHQQREPESSEHASNSFSSSSSSTGNNSAMREQLLDAALGHVKEYGWSHAALDAAARAMQLSPSATGVLKRREAELVEYAIKKWNQQLEEQLRLREEELLGMEIRERLGTALRLRLEMLQPHIDNWPQALSIATRPSNLGHSLKLLLSLTDIMWHAAGDQTTDSSWYSKRALLAGVYTSTELYMLTDHSPGYQDTWQAMDRRLSDMLSFSKIVSKVAADVGVK